MSDIQRYAPWPQEWPQEDPNGDLVEYEDHKKIVDALQARAEQLAATNERLEAALRLLHDNVVLAFPTLADLGPVANARAALKGDDHE